MRKLSLVSAILAGALYLAGCAKPTDATGCTLTGFSISATPADAITPDHTLAAPANQEQFLARQGALTGPGCATPQVIATVRAQWNTSDAKNISISSANDTTNGLATCLGATTATVTATLTQGTFTESTNVPFTCK